MTGGMAAIDDYGADIATDDPGRKGRLDEDPRRHSKGVWCLLEAQPRPY